MNEEQLTGFHGKLLDVKFINNVELKNVKAVELIAMARRSLSYLSNNPMPQHGYECRFSLAPLSCVFGVDIWAAEAILQLKILHPDIFLECALPCETQANKWNSADRERYFNILAASDKVTYISYQYTKDCIFKHNKYIVDNCDTLIAAFDGQKGGIAYTVNYASENNKQIIIINPKTGKVIPYLRIYGS